MTIHQKFNGGLSGTDVSLYEPCTIERVDDDRFQPCGQCKSHYNFSSSVAAVAFQCALRDKILQHVFDIPKIQSGRGHGGNSQYLKLWSDFDGRNPSITYLQQYVDPKNHLEFPLSMFQPFITQIDPETSHPTIRLDFKPNSAPKQSIGSMIRRRLSSQSSPAVEHPSSPVIEPSIPRSTAEFSISPPEADFHSATVIANPLATDMRYLRIKFSTQIEAMEFESKLRTFYRTNTIPPPSVQPPSDTSTTGNTDRDVENTDPEVPTSLSRDHYTVACICPMAVEAAPVIEMLDKRHQSLPTHHENSYTLGRIREHNVVVTVVPDTGNINTAAVVTQLRNDFPNIKFGLVIGIGGGIPGPRFDIRFGDVVVSKPTETYSGVVQFDKGKVQHDGEIRRTASLNKPPTEVRSHLETLRANHLRDGNGISESIKKMIEKNRTMKENGFIYQGAGNNILFQFDYQHPDPPADNCGGCDKSRIVPRDTRESPKVHYGTIGSSSLVIKDGETREQLQGVGNHLFRNGGGRRDGPSPMSGHSGNM